MMIEEEKVILLLYVVLMLYTTVAVALFFFAFCQVVIIDPSKMNNASISQIFHKLIFSWILLLIAKYIIRPLIESWKTKKDIKKIGG